MRLRRAQTRSAVVGAACIPALLLLCIWLVFSTEPGSSQTLALANLESANGTERPAETFRNSEEIFSANATKPLSRDSSSRDRGLIFTIAILLVVVLCCIYYGIMNSRKASDGDSPVHAHPRKVFKMPADIKGTLHSTAHNIAESKSNFCDWFFSASREVSSLTVSRSSFSFLGSGLSAATLSLALMLWLVIGTIVVSMLAKWPFGQSFFFVINTGLARGFTAPTPLGADSATGEAITVINELLGAVLFGAALAFLIDTLLDKVRGNAMDAVTVKCSDNQELEQCFSKVQTGGPYQTIPVDTTHDGFVDGIGVDTQGDGFVDTVIIRRPAVLMTMDRICFSIALAFWIMMGTAYGMVCEGWGFGHSFYFAFTTLGMGGVTTLGTDTNGFLSDTHAWALGIFILVGVPLFASTAAAYAGFLLERSIRIRERACIDAHIHPDEFELASRIIQPDDKLDRSEFVLLELLRMRKTDVTTIALIFKKFDEIDSSHDGTVDAAEIAAYNERLASAQGQELSYRLPWHTEMSPESV